MNLSFCPHMDRLTNDLIEAYRLLGDAADLWPVPSDSPDQITAIHHQMAEHRKSCIFCRRIYSSVATVDSKLIHEPNYMRPH